MEKMSENSWSTPEKVMNLLYENECQPCIQQFLFFWLDITSFFTVSALLFALSPILKTLTKTISTDTIYAMTVSFLNICGSLISSR